MGTTDVLVTSFSHLFASHLSGQNWPPRQAETLEFRETTPSKNRDKAPGNYPPKFPGWKQMTLPSSVVELITRKWLPGVGPFIISSAFSTTVIGWRKKRERERNLETWEEEQIKGEQKEEKWLWIQYFLSLIDSPPSPSWEEKSAYNQFYGNGSAAVCPMAPAISLEPCPIWALRCDPSTWFPLPEIMMWQGSLDAITEKALSWIAACRGVLENHCSCRVGLWMSGLPFRYAVSKAHVALKANVSILNYVPEKD